MATSINHLQHLFAFSELTPEPVAAHEKQSSPKEKKKRDMDGWTLSPKAEAYFLASVAKAPDYSMGSGRGRSPLADFGCTGGHAGLGKRRG